MHLSAEQIRVLGCLLEKEMTVPDTYPMTLNSLVTACNQSTSRNPVMTLSANEVMTALDGLRVEHRLVRILHSGAGSRVDKFKHVVEERLGLSRPEKAVMCVLALRGPQTLAELKTRTERMHDFAGPEAVDRVIDRLADPTIGADPEEPTDARDSGILRFGNSGPALPEGYARLWDSPMVVRLGRLPGTKEARVMHLLGGPVDESTLALDVAAPRHSPSGPTGSSGLAERVQQLEADLAALRAEFDAFRSQFG